MLRLTRFQYFAPRTLAEATLLLADHAPTAMVAAGGTDLFPNMKRRQQQPPVVIGLRSVRGLRSITGDGGAISIGATTSLHDVATHPLIRQHYPAFASAACLISTPHLRLKHTL